MPFGILIDDFNVDIVYSAGRVYGTNGPVVDVSTPTAPVRVGAFAFTGAIVPVPAKKRAYMVSPPSRTAPPTAKAQLRVLDTERFVQISATDVPGLTADDAVWDLIQTSDGQLAFLAGNRAAGNDGRVLFLPVDPLP